MVRRDHQSPELLADALEHVIYEIWKYNQSVGDYRNIVQTGGDAAMEFRVLHNWILLEFLYGSPEHLDRIVASDYIADWHLTHGRATKLWLDPYVDRCRTMLSPISISRVTKGKAGLRPWTQEWPDIEPYIDEAISEFLRGLSADHKTICRQWVDRWFRPGKPGGEALASLASALGS